MRASLLIAAHNEGDALWKTIRACVETIYDVSYEIVVADDASNDGSIENAVRRFPQIRVVSQPERLGASPTKHAAALEAEGDVLVFLDGHTNPEFGAIKRLIQGVEELNGQAILTPAVPYLDTTNWLNSRAQVGHGYSFKLDTLSCNWLSLKELPVREMGRRQFRESPALIGCALAVTGTSADVDRIKYGYDRASNRIWRQNPVATAAGAQFDEFYTNDGLQRLKDMQRGTLNSTNTAITVPTFEQCWTLDPTGNWLGFHEATLGGWPLDQSRTANTVNEITGITNTTGGSWATPTYDAAGNMTTIPRVSAPVGPLNWATLTSTDWSNLTTDQWSSMDVGPSSSGTGNAFTATYDAWNRLVSITDASTGQTVQQNQYDARTFRTVILSYTAGVLSETRHSYFSSNWRCVEERVGAATTAERQFVWGVRYIDDLVLRDRGTERLYALQDANWNVTSIVNSAGETQERYSYTAYGEPAFLTSSFGARSTGAYTWETLYCGYRFDTSTGLYPVRFRLYHPKLAGFCQRDPLSFLDGVNLYRYARFRPVRDRDPFGLCEVDDTEKWVEVHIRVRQFRSLSFTRRKFEAALKQANRLWEQCRIKIVVDNYSEYNAQETEAVLGDDNELEAMKWTDRVPELSADMKNLARLITDEEQIMPASALSPANGTPSLNVNFVSGFTCFAIEEPNGFMLFRTSTGTSQRLPTSRVQFRNDTPTPLTELPRSSRVFLAYVRQAASLGRHFLVGIGSIAPLKSIPFVIVRIIHRSVVGFHAIYSGMTQIPIYFNIVRHSPIVGSILLDKSI